MNPIELYKQAYVAKEASWDIFPFGKEKRYYADPEETENRNNRIAEQELIDEAVANEFSYNSYDNNVRAGGKAVRGSDGVWRLPKQVKPLVTAADRKRWAAEDDKRYGGTEGLRRGGPPAVEAPQRNPYLTRPPVVPSSVVKPISQRPAPTTTVAAPSTRPTAAARTSGGGLPAARLQRRATMPQPVRQAAAATQRPPIVQRRATMPQPVRQAAAVARPEAKQPAPYYINGDRVTKEQFYAERQRYAEQMARQKNMI